MLYQITLDLIMIILIAYHTDTDRQDVRSCLNSIAGIDRQDVRSCQNNTTR